MADLTLGEAKTIAIQHINRYSSSGEIIDSTDPNYLDLTLRMNPLANTAQMEIAKISKIPDKISISQNPIPNQLGLYAFDEVQHFPGADLVYTAAGSKSFSVEVDGDCEIYFDEEVSGVWTAVSGMYSANDGTPTAFSGSIVVSGLSAADLQEFKNYRGLLTISSATNNIRMKIVPAYPMKSRYRALFAYDFPNARKVPHCVAYIEYALPADYMEFDRMMREFDQRQYSENSDYILNGNKTIRLNWFLTGQFDIHYWKFPAEITNSTPDTHSFEVAKDGQAALPYYMGGYAIYPTNQNLGVQLLNQYYALLETLTRPKTNTASQIQNALW